MKNDDFVLKNGHSFCNSRYLNGGQAPLSTEEINQILPPRSKDAYVSYGTTLRPALPDRRVAGIDSQQNKHKKMELISIVMLLGIGLLQRVRGGLRVKEEYEALEEMAVELARARAAEKVRGWQNFTLFCSNFTLLHSAFTHSSPFNCQVRGWQQTLSRTGDVLHDNLWVPLCLKDSEQANPEGVPPQHCRRHHWLSTLFKYDTISWVIVVIVVTQAYRALLCFEYGPSVQVILTIAVARLLRVSCFTATTLPVIVLDCRLDWRGIENGGGCGDYLFSGHAVMQFVGLCMVWDGHIRSRPRWPLPLLLLLTLASAAALFGYAVERYHYTSV